MIDLSRAKVGDIVTTRSGKLCRVSEVNEGDEYPIVCINKHGTFRVTIEGRWLSNFDDQDKDIVKWAPKEAPTPSFLPLQVSGPNGPFYKTRHGQKVRIYALDGSYTNPIHSAALSDDGWNIRLLTKDGNNYSSSSPSTFDIVGLWVDKPEFDWSLCAKWHRYAAKHKYGWTLYADKPLWNKETLEWEILVGQWNLAAPIHPEHYPKWKGKDEDSLIERPN